MLSRAFLAVKPGTEKKEFDWRGAALGRSKTTPRNSFQRSMRSLNEATGGSRE